MTPAVEFHETLVQLLIGILFVMIAASVTPHEIGSVIGDGLALVAIMVLLIVRSRSRSPPCAPS